MADFSSDIPSPMTYFRGHIARRVADGSTGFFELSASRKNTKDYGERQHGFNWMFDQWIEPFPDYQRWNQVYQLSGIHEKPA